MGERANKILTHFDINVFLGSPEIEADDLIQGYINGTIEFNAELCQHNHEHHEHNHQHQHNHGHHNEYHFKGHDDSIN